jgi:hypothetical protein
MQISTNLKNGQKIKYLEKPLTHSIDHTPTAQSNCHHNNITSPPPLSQNHYRSQNKPAAPPTPTPPTANDKPHRQKKIVEAKESENVATVNTMGAFAESKVSTNHSQVNTKGEPS